MNRPTTDSFVKRPLRRPGWRIAVAATLMIACASSLSARHDDWKSAFDSKSASNSKSASASSTASGEASASTRPSRRGGSDGILDGDRGYAGMGRRPPGESWRDMQPPSPEEWQDVLDFMKENSPNRYEMYLKLEADRGADHLVTIGVRKRAAWRHRELKEWSDRRSDLYEYALRQFKIEDAVLATLSEIRRTGETPDLLARRQQQVHEFVENALKEREARLTKLRELVSREEAGLKQDRVEMASLEERQRERFERDMKRFIDFTVDGAAPATKPAGQ